MIMDGRSHENCAAHLDDRATRVRKSQAQSLHAALGSTREKVPTVMKPPIKVLPALCLNGRDRVKQQSDV
jgi:hypothetical protein